MSQERVVEQYQKDEKMMILIYAQWCVNQGLDAVELYKQAYPNQGKNDALLTALEQTVAKEEADHISDEIVLQVLQLFGNDDLAFVVQQEITKRRL